jgi:hypothetical protein
MMNQNQIEGTRLGAQIAKDKDLADRKSEFDGTKLGVDMAHMHDQIDVQKGQVAAQLIAAQMNATANEKAQEANRKAQTSNQKKSESKK